VTLKADKVTSISEDLLNVLLDKTDLLNSLSVNALNSLSHTYLSENNWFEGPCRRCGYEYVPEHQPQRKCPNCGTIN